jgi:hypothetical protein
MTRTAIDSSRRGRAGSRPPRLDLPIGFWIGERSQMGSREFPHRPVLRLALRMNSSLALPPASAASLNGLVIVRQCRMLAIAVELETCMRGN